MTELDGVVDEDKRPLARGKNPREPVAPGRWVNPILGILGTLVLSGYLMTGLLSPRLRRRPPRCQMSG